MFITLCSSIKRSLSFLLLYYNSANSAEVKPPRRIPIVLSLILCYSFHTAYPTGPDYSKKPEREVSFMNEPVRCFGNTPLYITYHDTEWGRPVHENQKLFEMLILEGAQAGLSWITVLNKREAYREAFDGFDPARVAQYDEKKIQELLTNAGVIRNRLKINAAIVNARLFLQLQEKHGSFDQFIWSYVDHKPIVGHWEKIEDIPITTPISDQISKDLKKMGFKFVGSTIIYSFMQAVGMVNDHLRHCCVYEEVLSESQKH